MSPTGNDPAGGESRSAAGRAVLIVDDNENTAKALATLLLRGGLPTAVFQHGSDALRHIKQHPLLAAVVDIHLPDMNGMILTQRIREACGPFLPIVLVSGDTSIATLNSLAYVGATHFFSKPISASHLLKQLKGWIEEAETETRRAVPG